MERVQIITAIMSQQRIPKSLLNKRRCTNLKMMKRRLKRSPNLRQR